MKDGFVKVACATPEIRVADCKYNTKKIIDIMQGQTQNGVNLLVFPELCITGSTCGDLFLQKALLQSAVDGLEEIKKASDKLETVIIVGLPLSVNSKLFDCAAVIYKGNILGVVPKTNIFKSNHFSKADNEITEIKINDKKYPFGTKLLFSCIELPEFKIGVEICEDIWAPVSPSVFHAKAGATVIANPSADYEAVGRESLRRNLVISSSAKLACGYVFSNAGQGESTTDVVFSGHSVIAENGNIIAEALPFSSDIASTELDVFKLDSERCRNASFENNLTGYKIIEFSMPLKKTELSRTVKANPFIPLDNDEIQRRCEAILSIQSKGLEKRILHCNCKSLVIGISGGLDSCLAMLVASRAVKNLNMDKKSIVAVTMPCFGTSSRTFENAKLLCSELGVVLKHIDIAKSVTQHFEDIGHDISNHNVVFENAQARERTQILMDIANKTNGIVIGTGDLSELALGFATYNGDHMSMYGVNACVPKTLMRYIIRYYADSCNNEKLKAVLYDIVDTPVSPELLPADKEGKIAQKTEEIVGPYELHDFFLYYIVRWGFSPEKILRLCMHAYKDIYSEEIIKHWLKLFYRRFFSQQFKRSCLPDGPRIASVCLSPRGAFSMPSDACADIWLNDIEKF